MIQAFTFIGNYLCLVRIARRKWLSKLNCQTALAIEMPQLHHILRHQQLQFSSLNSYLQLNCFFFQILFKKSNQILACASMIWWTLAECLYFGNRRLFKYFHYLLLGSRWASNYLYSLILSWKKWLNGTKVIKLIIIYWISLGWHFV